MMQSVRQQYCRRIMTSYANSIKNPRSFVKLDGTAIYLNYFQKRTIQSKGEKPALIILCGTSGMRLTSFVSVAMDGTKLWLLAIFRDTLGGSIEQQLPSMLPAWSIGYAQGTAWMDDRSMEIWNTNIYKPYIPGYTCNCGSLLDSFI